MIVTLRDTAYYHKQTAQHDTEYKTGDSYHKPLHAILTIRICSLRLPYQYSVTYVIHSIGTEGQDFSTNFLQ